MSKGRISLSGFPWIESCRSIIIISAIKEIWFHNLPSIGKAQKFMVIKKNNIGKALTRLQGIRSYKI